MPSVELRHPLLPVTLLLSPVTWPYSLELGAASSSSFSTTILPPSGGLLSHMGDVPTYWLFSSLTNHLQGLHHFSREYSGHTVDLTVTWYRSTSKTLHPTPPSLTIPLSLCSCPPGHSHSSCSLSSGRPPGPGSPVFLLSALTLSFSFLLLQEPSLNSLVILSCMLSTWQLCPSLARRASRTRLSSAIPPPHPIQACHGSCEDPPGRSDRGLVLAPVFPGSSSRPSNSVLVFHPQTVPSVLLRHLSPLLKSFPTNP